MGKKKRGAVPTEAPAAKKSMVIDMNKAELAKAYQVPGFRTGRHMTEKDRPRKKNWKKEYLNRTGRLNDNDFPVFIFRFLFWNNLRIGGKTYIINCMFEKLMISNASFI